MKTVALIQARMSSSRFPGKVLEDLAGRPMIAYMIDRARRARSLDLVAIITSTDPSDDPLAEFAEQRSMPLFRGALHDVLERYAGAAEAFAANVVVRLTGDCPLIDPDIIDSVVGLRARTGADYCCNIAPPTYADGLDVECFTQAVLERARREARQPAEREHVTLWMRSGARGLLCENYAGLVDTSHLRLTVDYPDDLEVVRRIIARNGNSTRLDQFDILRCLDAERSLLDINLHERNEGLRKSINEAGNGPANPHSDTTEY